MHTRVGADQNPRRGAWKLERTLCEGPQVRHRNHAQVRAVRQPLCDARGEAHPGERSGPAPEGNGRELGEPEARRAQQLIHHRQNALGVSALDRGSDVEGQIFGFDQALGEFTCVQRNVYLGVNAVKILEHSHVLVEIVDRHVPVLGHHKVQANEARVGGSQLESQQDLCEHIAGR